MQELGMILEWAVQIGLGFAGAVLFYAPLARKVYNLQCDLATTQAQLLKEKNSRAALVRYKDKESLEVLRDLAGQTPPAVPRNPLSKFKLGG